MPDVAGFGFAGLFQFCVYIEIIFFRFIAVNCKEVSDFFFIKSGQTKVKAEILQFFHFHSKQFFIPAGVQCHTIVGKNKCFLLCFCHVFYKYTRNLRHAFGLGGFQSAVSAQDVIILVDYHRTNKSEFSQGRTKFQDLFFVVCTSIICVWY